MVVLAIDKYLHFFINEKDEIMYLNAFFI